MNKSILFLISSMLLVLAQWVSAAPVFINEIHYDNSGGDVGEGVEIAGLAGQDLAGWSLVFYNGASSSPYMQRALGGVLDNEVNGYGALAFSISGLQNGAADGVALLDPLASVVQFLSYEGSVTAVAGAAVGSSSVDIGVAESGVTAVGMSLQLIGAGREYGDFFWSAAATETFGVLNSGQSILPLQLDGVQADASVPAPPSLAILLAGLAALWLSVRGPAGRLFLACRFQTFDLVFTQQRKFAQTTGCSRHESVAECMQHGD